MAPRRQIATRHGHLDAIVERGKISRVSAAAGVPGTGDPRRVDFRAREQVVQSADAVPDRVTRQEVPGEQALNAEDRMLGGRARYFGFLEIDIEQLHPLTLADGVPGHSHVASPGESHENLLPGSIRLPASLVSERKQHSRIRRLTGGGKVKVHGDVKARLALKNNLLDLVAVTL